MRIGSILRTATAVTAAAIVLPAAAAECYLIVDRSNEVVYQGLTSPVDLSAEGKATRDALRARGEHLIVAPGGMREAMRPFWGNGSVNLGDRRGYLRLALRHGLPIVPAVAAGIDDTFLGLNDGYALSRRLFGRGDLPAWLALGVGGVWPLALPFPVKLRQRIGAPIRLDPDTPIDAAHARVTATLQAMLDELHGRR